METNWMTASADFFTCLKGSSSDKRKGKKTKGAVNESRKHKIDGLATFADDSITWSRNAVLWVEKVFAKYVITYLLYSITSLPAYLATAKMLR